MTAKTKKIINDWFTIPFVGALLLGLLFEFRQLMVWDIPEVMETVIISFLYWTVLANGNTYLICKIDERYSWLEAPVKRTIVGVIVMFVFTFIAATIILYFQTEFYFNVRFIDVLNYQGWTVYAIPFGITLIMSLWGHGSGFLTEWKDAATKVERLKTESMKSKFESLRNQVNPHFLFNSLNALSSLVYDDQRKAVEFIQKLSDVYRYVLDTQKEEVVPVQEELKFLESFVYLNRIRFGENFSVEIEGFDHLSDHEVIPPVALQMLIENCIKHNEISKDRKLSIKVTKDGDQIVVENNINHLPEESVDSKGLGLKNIIMRYEILSDEKVVIENDESTFRVILPVLKMKK